MDDALMKHLPPKGSGSTAPFPHCDPRVLHRPGTCVFCDYYPVYQALREAWNINYTGIHREVGLDGNLMLCCPAERSRPLQTINRWYGNVARTEDEIAAEAEVIDKEMTAKYGEDWAGYKK